MSKIAFDITIVYDTGEHWNLGLNHESLDTILYKLVEGKLEESGEYIAHSINGKDIIYLMDKVTDENN